MLILEAGKYYCFASRYIIFFSQDEPELNCPFEATTPRFI